MAYQYRRPYYPYVNRNRYQTTNPGQAMTSAIEGGTKLGEQVAKAIEANKQNQVANQLAAQYGLYAPRAAWVGGTPPAAGVNTSGTSLADQGGVEGLKLRMAMQQRQQTQQAANTKAQLQQALIDQARGKAKSVWTGRTNSQVQQPGQPGKTGAYKAGAYNYENGTLNGQKTADSMEYIQKDLDGATGKTGTAATLLAALPQIKIVNGKPTIPVPLGEDGKPDPNYKPSYRFNDDGSFSVLDRNGNPSSTIQSGDLQTTLNRLNALKVRNGETPLPNPYLKGTQSTSTFQPGSKENPYALDPNKPNTTFRALPFGSYFTDPKGNIQLKQDPTKVQQTPQNTVNTPANQFSRPDEGGTSTDVTVPNQPSSANLPGHIPTRPTASSDESSGDSQRLSYLNGAQPDNTPVSPNAPVDSGGNTIARIDPNSFAPPSQQTPNQIADAILPNTGVVPTPSDDNTDLLNRMIVGQNLLDQSSQT